MKYLFLIFCLILCSCSDEHHYGCEGGRARKTTAMKSSSEESGSSDFNGCSGPPPPPDSIKPSSENLWFNAEGGMDSITTEGENWHIAEAIIVKEDTVIFLSSSQYYVRGDGLEELRAYEYNIPYLVDGDNEYSIISIDGSWFTVDKPDKKKIVFSVKQNETEKEREFSVLLVDRNYYSVYIEVKQSPMSEP